jgi:putative transposase
MFILLYKHRYDPKFGLKSKECIDFVLKSLTDHITIKVNGSLASEDIFPTVRNMSVDKNSVHSVSKKYHDIACKTSLRYHLRNQT